MKYVASLYSLGINFGKPEHLDVLHNRVRYTMKRTHELMLYGELPYSPIVHCHQIAMEYDLPKDYDWWQKTDRNMIDRCDEVIVFMMQDNLGSWKDSVGMTDEINYAKQIGKPVKYLECDDYE